MSVQSVRKKDRSSLKWVWGQTRSNRLKLLVLTFVRVLIALCSVFEALALRGLINGAVDHDQQIFLRYCIIFIVLIAVQIFSRTAARYLDEHTKASVENHIKLDLFKTLLEKDYSQVTAFHSAEWMNRLTNDVVVIANGIADIVPNLAATLARLLGAFSLIFYLVSTISWVIVVCAVFGIVITFFLRKKLKALHKKIQEADGRVRVFLSERLSNLIIIRSFSMEDDSVGQASDKMDGHLRARMKRNYFSNICNTGFNIFIYGIYIGAVIYCGHGILTGDINYGTFAAVVNLAGKIQAPVTNISSYVPRWYAMLASAERVMEAERFKDDLRSSQKTEKEILDFYNDRFAAIELRNARFSYVRTAEDGEKNSDSVVLQDIDVRIDKQNIAAITGASGCGKSTLLKIIMSFYALDGGERSIITDSDIIPLDASWRGLFAYVPQGNQLMSGKIRDVLTFGRNVFSDDEIRGALAISCARDFVEQLPDGLDTVLGERGSGLSEGQMQRIAIARAVLSRHPVILLDEATSSLDEETEEKLLHNLRSLTDRTVIIVTHRLKVLSICDLEIQMGEEGVKVKELKR